MTTMTLKPSHLRMYVLLSLICRMLPVDGQPGMLDSTFAQAGIFQIAVSRGGGFYDMAVQADNKILACGAMGQDLPHSVVVRYNYGLSSHQTEPLFDLKIYPDPGNRELHLYGNKIDKLEYIRLWDAINRKVFRIDIPDTDHLAIPTGQLPVGMYFLEVDGKAGKQAIPITIQH